MVSRRVFFQKHHINYSTPGPKSVLYALQITALTHTDMDSFSPRTSPALDSVGQTDGRTLIRGRIMRNCVSRDLESSE